MTACHRCDGIPRVRGSWPAGMERPDFQPKLWVLKRDGPMSRSGPGLFEPYFAGFRQVVKALSIEGGGEGMKAASRMGLPGKLHDLSRESRGREWASGSGIGFASSPRGSWTTGRNGSSGSARMGFRASICSRTREPAFLVLERGER